MSDPVSEEIRLPRLDYNIVDAVTSIQNSLHVIDPLLVLLPVILRRRARRFVRGHPLRNLLPNAILKVLSDSGCSKRVIAHAGLDTRGKGSPADHSVYICLPHRVGR